VSRSKQQILFLAPQPFFQERGTPIAVKLALEALAGSWKSANGDEYEVKIKLLTYHEGFDIEIPDVEHIRMWAPRWLAGIRPGVSLKKLIADVFYFYAALKLLIKKDYSVIHAVEESIFMALPFALIFNKKIIYDMDSSLSMQLREKWKILSLVSPIFDWFEKFVIKNSNGVLAVCDDLVRYALEKGNHHVSALYDISLLPDQNQPTQENLRLTVNIPEDANIVVYVGNLETYQGVDLLVDSMKVIKERNLVNCHCIIIGGAPSHIEKYYNLAKKLSVDDIVHFIGPRPLINLAAILSQATVLASPRIKGNNTPMKVYSYLDSGVPVVATKLLTHTQAMTDNEAYLAEPNSKEYADKIIKAINDSKVSNQKSRNAKILVQSRYTKEAFTKKIREFYLNIFQK
jgi:glycosyltransferase involved in cell wall biosynthesis